MHAYSSYDDDNDYDADDDDVDPAPRRKRNRERQEEKRRTKPRQERPQERRRRGASERPRRPKHEADTFRCGHCKRLVGPTLSGGSHRNHCPVCLYSRHVDGKTPGDRASDCRSLMAAVALLIRPSGEQAIVHRCLGCGFERHNRVAADDNPLAIMRLPVLPPAEQHAERQVAES